jgi:hypothetical protein
MPKFLSKAAENAASLSKRVVCASEIQAPRKQTKNITRLFILFYLTLN